MPHNKIKNAFIEQIKLAFILISLCIALIFTDWLWTWDQTLYDIQVRASTSPAPNDVVIIAIDETSLNDFGRWPWQRSTHAALIDRLNEMGAKIIVMDVIFSEETKNNKAADRALADAIHRAKNVILPVLAEQTRLGSQLKETLPLPMLIEAGAKLGHVHIELDADGIARSVFLYEGLGKPRWPHISLAALQQDNSQQIISRATHGKNRSPFSWHRTQQKLIHFLGPPGQFKRISYRDVIRGAVKKESINGKTVFVGVTATGLGDALPTPVSGLTQPMSGVEINANIFASLRDNSNYQVMKNPWRLIISIIIIMLPIIFLPRTSPRGALILCTSLIFFSLSLSLALIYYWHTWFAPLAVILPLALCYPLWSWRRLEYTTQYLESQIKLLHKEPVLLPNHTVYNATPNFDFIAEILNCHEWAIYDQGKNKVCGTANSTPRQTDLTKIYKWTIQDNTYWLKWLQHDKPIYLAFMLAKGANFTHQQRNVLANLRTVLQADFKKPVKDTSDIIEQQISQVKAATDSLRAMRRFISASLDQMADAVLVSSTLGDIVLYNQQAEHLFGGKNLEEKSFLSILSQCKLAEKKNWKAELVDIIAQNKATHIQGTHQSNKNLLIQLSPLITNKNQLSGLIANFSDITSIKNSEKRRNEYIDFLSHDLRSPLSSALALIELNMNKNTQDHDLERLKQYTERALGLTENFVQLARADNLDQINFLECDLINILYNATDQLWELASQKSISIDIETFLQSAEYMGDASLLERAVINILDNAIKYSPDKSKITVILEKTLTHYRCAISDQGRGITASEMPTLFTRFQRRTENKHKNIPGIGLGLAFVKTVIEAHGGKVEVASKINHGTTFSLKLPIKNLKQ